MHNKNTIYGNPNVSGALKRASFIPAPLGMRIRHYHYNEYNLCQRALLIGNYSMTDHTSFGSENDLELITTYDNMERRLPT